MELQDVLDQRKSIRHYEEKDIPKEDILEIIKAAGKAPSGKNIQNWHFVVVKNQDLKEKIAKVISDKNEEIALRVDQKDEKKGKRFRKFVKNFTLFFLKAPVLVVVFTRTYYPSGYAEMELAGYSKEFLNQHTYFRNSGMQSLGAALENFTLKAIDMGYGSCWLTSANYAAKELEALLEKEIGFKKEDYYMGAMMVLGVPKPGGKTPPKKDVEEIYTFVE